MAVKVNSTFTCADERVYERLATNKELYQSIGPPFDLGQQQSQRTGHPLTLSTESLSAEKRQALTIRRLDKIVYDRRVIWRDERG